MKHPNIKCSFFSFMLLLSLLLDLNKYTLISLIASVIHEFGHIFASKCLGIKLTELNFGLLGARLKISNEIHSYKDEVILAAAGPFFNFLSSAIIFCLSSKLSINKSYINIFIISSILLGLLNLLPINTFDGGRICEAVLLMLFSLDAVKKIMNASSFISVFSLWCISVYFLLIYSSSINLFVFSASLFCNLFINESS